MKKAAFLSMDSLNGFECHDHLLFDPLKKLGWLVEEVSWRREDVDWNLFDAVIVRSTWDYQSEPEKFLKALEIIDNSSAHLENDLSILKWNMNKNYLNDLQKKGVYIVDSIWEKKFSLEKMEEYFDLLNSNEIIIKPNISANANNTFKLKKSQVKGQKLKFKSIFENREFMVQLFMKSIVDEGEYSLFYFGGVYSHTILKKPKENDFRVQEEHGGKLMQVHPLPGQKEISENILNKMEKIPLYARVDLVRTPDNNFALMELELIEPSLYFNMDKESPKRFAEIFADWMKKI